MLLVSFDSPEAYASHGTVAVQAPHRLPENESIDFGKRPATREYTQFSGMFRTTSGMRPLAARKCRGYERRLEP